MQQLQIQVLITDYVSFFPLLFSDHFPYFKTASNGWKNSVRHNLSLNNYFEKIEKPGNGPRRGALWTIDPAKVDEMEKKLEKWSKKDPLGIRRAMSDPGKFFPIITNNKLMNSTKNSQ